MTSNDDPAARALAALDVLGERYELIEGDPAYTSQTCHECGHVAKESRRSQSKFECVACGHQGNADVNAALNVKARGTGASGRRGAWASAPPMNRQQDMPRVPAPALAS